MHLTDKIQVFNEDCMAVMSRYPDKHFDLAVVDPPYGIGAGSVSFKNGAGKSSRPYYKENDWDLNRPPKEYFEELRRVSKNQIVWGGNYFADYLGAFRCYIVWDKTIHGNSYADCELAWCSADSVARYYRKNMAQVNTEGRIHPTQKPVTLYNFLFTNFAESGMKILDTHGGSMSSVISADKNGMEMVCCELDKDYFDKAVERFNRYKSQLTLGL